MKFFLTFILLLSFGIGSYAQTDPVIRMAESLVPNVVRLEVELENRETPKGFGFVTNESDNYLYIVTAAHVLHGAQFDLDAKRITVYFSSSLERKSAREITWFEDEDLALLRVEKPTSYSWRFPFAATSVDTYNNVGFIGRNNRFNILKGGYIFEINKDNLFFTPSFILPGTSGAPLINRSGIVGMITDDSVEGASALSIRRIRDLLQVPSGGSPYFAGAAPSVDSEPGPTPAEEILGQPMDGFIKITGGSFQMGDQFGEGGSDEKPVHTVQVSDFMMSPTEVTNEEVAAFLNAEGNQSTDGVEWYEIGSSRAKVKQSGNGFRVESGYAQHPVVELNWYGAIHFCNWKSEQAGLQQVYTISGTSVSANWSANGYRLPTEAEWEYAAREGGRKVRFGNGENTARASQMNFDASADYKKSYSEVGTYRKTTVAVNSLKKNSLGLYHMSGNVWEWCWDWYAADYYSNSAGASDPRGPGSGEYRVVRGGSWSSNPYVCRAADRLWINPSDRYYGVGFRLVRHAP